MVSKHKNVSIEAKIQALQELSGGGKSRQTTQNPQVYQ